LVTSDDYPLLQTVPPRPQLSYTVQQQREIVEALIADRENARYTSQVVRYRSGLSTLPPPPAPPESNVTEAPEQTAPAGGEASTEPDVAKPQEGLLRAETFDVFLRALSRRFHSDAPEPEATEAAPLPDAPAEPIEPEQGAAAQVVPTPDVALAAGSVNDSADGTAPQAPHPPAETGVAARPAAGSDQLIVSPPLPPTETALAARRATGADAPLPPTQTAVAARQAADPTDPEGGAPIPTPRPDHAAHADPIPAITPEPPPGKPAWPIDGGSAAVAAPQAVASAAAFTVLATRVRARPLPPIAVKAVL
jgi:nicotinate-nucleotide--dimethylbenzimidazole phosphoribosyltransferase